MRQIVLDTETTGLEVSQGHRIIEVGCVELVNRKLTGNRFHEYCNPERAVDTGAFEVHGISDEFLADKPVFAEIAEAFLKFIDGAELVIHNATFDVGFIDAEFARLDDRFGNVSEHCKVTDSLLMARERHPGQRNSLDALCKRYDVENFDRSLHGALLDSEILAAVYLRMTGGQTSLGLQSQEQQAGAKSGASKRRSAASFKDRRGRVIEASADEQAQHEALLDLLDKSSGGECLWRKVSAPG